MLITAGLLYYFSMVTLTIAAGFVLYLLVEQALGVCRRNGLSDGESYVVLSLIGLALFVAFVLYVSIPLVEQVRQISDSLPTTFERLNEQLAHVREMFPFIDKIIDGAKAQLFDSVKTLLDYSGALITGLVTAPIIAGTLVATRKELGQLLKSYIPNDYFEVIMTIVYNSVAHLEDYVSAKGIETVGMIIIYAIGFQLISMPNGLLLAIVGGLLNIIPYLGPLLTAPLFGFAAIVAGDWSLAGWAMVVLGVGQFVDNMILQTWVLAKYVDLHPLLVIIVTLLGGELFGALGLIIAIPIFVISKLILVGLYDILRALQRHEVLLEQEERDKQYHAGNNHHHI
ncbi:AI-2E family transporter [Candidatus Woesearchaeota archaeon]|nr:AI-2E family transporter [Candidatus Woesearchaeota archaeon]